MIPKQFTLTKRLYEEFKEDYQAANPTLQAVDEYLKNQSTGNWWHYDLGQSFQEEYHYHIKSDSYFIGCTFSKYKSTYKKRKNKYLSKSVDAIEIDFIVKELNEISKVGFEYCPTELKEAIQHSVNRQKDFLLKQAKVTNSIITTQKNRWGELRYSYRNDWSKEKADDLIDLSNTSLIQKVRYLEILGVFEYLKTRTTNGYTQSSIASITSSFTGEKAQSLQPILSALDNPNDHNKNNPYKKDTKVQEVKTAIAGLGFKFE